MQPLGLIRVAACASCHNQSAISWVFVYSCGDEQEYLQLAVMRLGARIDKLDRALTSQQVQRDKNKSHRRTRWAEMPVKGLDANLDCASEALCLIHQRGARVSLVACGSASAINLQIGDLRQIQAGRYGRNETIRDGVRQDQPKARSIIETWVLSASR
jgi:hypothetical protein